MANEEALTLDGLALNDGITFGMVKFDAPVPRQRQDWIGAADSEAQLLVRNPLHDNRKITVRLAVITQASMNVAHDKLLLVLDKLQKASRYTDGISLTWTPATGTRTATFDVLSAEIVDLPIDWESGWLSFSPEFTVEMTAKPYWRGTETLTATASSSTPFVTLEVASVTGDVPALGRLIVTDTATQSRRHVEWGLEGPLTYNSGTSLLIESDSLVTTGFAGVQGTAAAGAYDVGGGNTSIGCDLYAGRTTAVCGTGNQSHVGAFRVKARIYATVSTQVRLSWRAGDGPTSSNAWFTVPTATSWIEADLGTITVPTTLAGTQRWTGTIEGLQAVGGQVYVDYIELIPTSDGYGKARAAYSYVNGVTVGYDAFVGTTAAAALNARVAPLGGTWATSGDATDFVFVDNLNVSAVDGIESISRSTNVVETNGRYAILGSTNYTDTQVDVRARGSSTPRNAIEQTVIARWTDSSNHLRLVVPEPAVGTVRLEQVVAGVVTVLATSTWTTSELTNYRFRLIAFASGRTIGQVLSDAGSILTQMDASSTALATGGTLQTGKPGLRDRATSTSPYNRYFTHFAVSTPPAEPIAIYSGRNMQVRHDDVIRQDSTGTYIGRPSSYRGSRFLVPVGTSRVLVKARRNDVEETTDDNVIDATQIQVGWTPRGLAVPR